MPRKLSRFGEVTENSGNTRRDRRLTVYLYVAARPGIPRLRSFLLRAPRKTDGVTAYCLSSASAVKTRAHERMPPWKLDRSYFSFGE